MSLKVKTCGLTQIKSEGDQGVFTALASTYDIDSVGDKVRPGAFAKTLVDWATKGLQIPLLWSHRMDDPDFNLGTVTQAKETDNGLLVTAQLDLTHAKSMQAYKLLKGHRINNLSFAYDVVDQAPGTIGGKSFNELRELKLYEVSLTPIGANQHTQVLAVKEAAAFLQSLNSETLSKSDVVELMKALRSTGTLVEQVLGRLPDTEGRPQGGAPAEKQASRVSVMEMQTRLLSLHHE